MALPAWRKRLARNGGKNRSATQIQKGYVRIKREGGSKKNPVLFGEKRTIERKKEKGKKIDDRVDEDQGVTKKTPETVSHLRGEGGPRQLSGGR